MKESKKSLYLYDNPGDRVWKLTGNETLMQINGQTTYSNVNFEKTLYTSPYLVMTEEEYTKHYFIEGERVCSKVGGGFGPADVPPTSPPLEFIAGDEEVIAERLNNMVNRQIYCTGYSGGWDFSEILEPAYDMGNHYEELQYFYHPDHLGSSSFITERHGLAEQHLQYLPFGELWVSQRNSYYDTRYKFSAKELDSESGYNYFGARYYDSELSNWLSVDPMADERSWVSPYSYVQNSPVNRVDPSGALDDGFTVDKKGCVEKVDHTGGDIFDVLYSKENYDKGLRKYDDYGDDETGIMLEKGILDNEKTINGSINGEPAEVNLYNVKGDKTAKGIFEFLSDNTNVEWGHTFVGLAKDEQSWIGTSHFESKDASHDVVFSKWGYTVRGHNHSHPYNNIPSRKDKSWANTLNTKNPKAKLNIYYNSNYYQYDNKGLIFNPSIYNSPEVIIKP